MRVFRLHLVNVLSDLCVLSEQLLGLCKACGRVLIGNGCLCVREPLLEVVKVLQEMLKLRGFAKSLLT